MQIKIILLGGVGRDELVKSSTSKFLPHDVAFELYEVLREILKKEVDERIERAKEKDRG